MHWRDVFDAGGPAMMLSYGLGRFGCHFSGDGDWGIANLKPNPGLPDWAWAYKYPHNVLGKDYASTGMEMIPGCSGEYCYQLAVPVYPTPLYEAVMALGLFAVMWFVLRKRNLAPFQMFSTYMMMAGLERMLIESIREHGVSLYNVAGMSFSQAQMISLALMLFGVLGWIWAGKSPRTLEVQQKVD
jgi:prolipoprotein diacylglyceryltransferase